MWCRRWAFFFYFPTFSFNLCCERENGPFQGQPHVILVMLCFQDFIEVLRSRSAPKHHPCIFDLTLRDGKAEISALPSPLCKIKNTWEMLKTRCEP